ncbi:protein IFH1 [Arachis duranensis]|uniref:Protein IFH1 n=2 Tax=Arachis TaxID=3817 RepID=A0A6P4BP90_ARADU|nr:protein IFH1 [Arachis duranensis]
MGCFMACFGLSNKRKRKKALYNVNAANQKYGSYEALAIKEKAMIPYSDLRKRDECKEQNNVKSKKKKKKVTFNLNVQIYEPDPTAYKVLDNEEEEHENSAAEPAKKNSNSPSVSGEGSASLTVTYPPNYRYYNCSEDFGEEEDVDYEESDIDDYEDDEEFDDGYDCDDGSSDKSLENDEAEAYGENSRQKELSDLSNSSAAEYRTRNQMAIDASGRDRSTNMHSVLSPVENLTQWKAIKAKVPSSKHRRKENVPSIPSTTTEACSNFSPCFSMKSSVLQSKPRLPQVAVDASLSNWLISPNFNVSKTTIHCQL